MVSVPGPSCRPSVQGVNPQCAASWMTYARDSFVDSQGGLLSSRGGGGGADTLAPVLQFLPLALFWATHRLPCSVTSVVVRWYSVWRMTFCTRSIVSIKACVPCS